MNNTEKEAAYRTLCNELADMYKEYALKQEKNRKNENDIYLEWCEFCKEINLWTYWQGIGNYNPKILVLGQDWASFRDKYDLNKYRIEKVEENVKNGDTCHYFDLKDASVSNKEFDTDINLAEQLEKLGYEDVLTKRNKDLFFSNICLGYRNSGASGNFKMSWVTDIERYVYKKLIDILEPKVIICLGKSTYKAALKVFKLKDKRINSSLFNEFLDTYLDDNDEGYISYKGIPILVSAHCGTLGMNNRGRSKMDADWRRIASICKKV